MSRLLSYFKVTGLGEIDDLANRLWIHEDPSDYLDDDVAYKAIVLEQYKLYVEMADRVSSRRLTANSFFLTLNTAVFALIGATWDERVSEAEWGLIFPLIGLLLQCLTWFWTIRSYRQLNTAKWAVVGALERRLPAAPYSDAEWLAVGEGRDPSRYWPISKVETWIPLLFALTYIGGFVALLAA